MKTGLLSTLRSMGRIWLQADSTAEAASQLGSFLFSKLLDRIRRISPTNARFGPAKGFFSSIEQLNAGEVQGRIIFSRQQSITAGVNSIREQAGLAQQGYQPWPFFWATYHEARLVGKSLVCMDEKKRICVEGAYERSCLKLDPAYRTLWLPRARALQGHWTSVISQWTLLGNYYHWFTDALTRLAALEELPPTTRILIPSGTPQFALQSLEWLGLGGRYRVTPENHLNIEHFHFISPMTMTGCDNSAGVRFLRESFLKRGDRSFEAPRRFFVRRRGKKRGLINEREVHSFFARRGWEVIDTEELTLGQQIELFSQAHEICGVHGAGLTNLLWCQPSCRVTEIFADTYLNGCYEGIASALDLDYRYLIGRGDRAKRVRVSLEALELAIS